MLVLGKEGVCMTKASELKLNIACLGAAAYALVASLDKNTRLCPPGVRAAVRQVTKALGQKHLEMMFESSCNLVKAMDKVFTPKSKVYKAKGFDGDTVRDWYLRIRIMLVLLNQIEDKNAKEWFMSEDGKSGVRMIKLHLIQTAEQLIEEDEQGL